MRLKAHITLVIVLVLAVVAFTTIGTGSPRAADRLSELTELQEEALATMLEANKLAIQLGLLLYAAWGSLLFADDPVIRLGELPDVVCMTISLGGATLALYCGYMQYDKVVEMLAARYFDPNSAVVLAPRDLQLWSLLTGLVLLAVGVVLGGHRQALARSRGTALATGGGK